MDLKIGLVCTQGGHLTELLQVLDAFNGYDIFFVTHHSSRDEELKQIARSYFTDSVSANVFRFIKSFWDAYQTLNRERPDVIISTGAEVAVPHLILGKFFSAKTIYLESWCRIKTKSITGRIVYPLVDIFLVQWPQMLEVYGKKAQYWGAVI